MQIFVASHAESVQNIFSMTTILTSEQIRALIDAGKSFWVATETERKLAKTLGGACYTTAKVGKPEGGFNVCRLNLTKRKTKSTK